MTGLMAGTYSINWAGSGINNGYQVWSSYDRRQVVADMAANKALGANTVRVALNSVYGLHYPIPNATQLSIWRDFQAICRDTGLLIEPALYDYGGDAQVADPVECQQWATAWWAATDPAVIAAVIDIKNEGRYNDPVKGPALLAWAKTMIPFFRSLTGKEPTASTASTLDLRALLAATKGTPAELAVCEYHFYAALESVNSELVGLLGIIGDPSRLFLGEYGRQSVPASGQSIAQAEQEQVDWMRFVRARALAMGFGEAAPWASHELDSGGVYADAQLRWGILRKGGELKPAAQAYLDQPFGGPVVMDYLNGNMTGIRVDSSGNTLPARWVLYRGEKGAQPVAGAVDTTFLIAGQPSLRLTGSAASVTTDNAPGALTAIGVPKPGPTGKLSITGAIAGLGACGQPRLTANFYAPNGTWLSSANGPLTTPTTTAARSSFTAAAPATATWMTLGISTPANGGTVYLGDVTIDPI